MRALPLESVTCRAAPPCRINLVPLNIIRPPGYCACVKSFTASMLRPLRVCDRQKEKGSEIDASPQLPISDSTGVQLLDRSRLAWSIDRDYQGQLSWRLKSRVLMYSYATRGLGFLVRCATISRQLGQGPRSSVVWGSLRLAPIIAIRARDLFPECHISMLLALYLTEQVIFSLCSLVSSLSLSV